MCAVPLREVPSLYRGRRPHHARRDRVGTWEILCLTNSGEPHWSASERRGAKTDAARTWEVRLCHSSCEADEQSRATDCGAGGAKGAGQGECGPSKHVPGTEPGKRVTGAEPRTTTIVLLSNTRGGSRMREIRTYGSGAARLAAIL